MSGFTKLFGSIVASTVWEEDNETRIVWITMLALADSRGIVEASVPGLAHLARVSQASTRRALSKLGSPDPDSRSKAAAGRRVEPVDGGWLLVNHAKYRAKLNADERREYLRIKQAEHRAKKRGRVNSRKQKSTLSSKSTHTDPDPDPDPERESTRAREPSAGFPTREEWHAHCQTVGLPAWREEDEWLNQEAKGWARIQNPAAYAARVAGWWRADGSPMSPPSKSKGIQDAKAEAARQAELRSIERIGRSLDDL